MTKQKKKYKRFSRYSNRLWDNQILTKNQWMVYCEFCRHRDNYDGTTYPGMNRIKKITRLTKNQVQYSIKILEELGIIKKIEQGGRGRKSRNVYELLDLEEEEELFAEV